MELKDYQRRALDALRTFLDQAAIRNHAAAYAAACAVGEPGAYGAAYRPLTGLSGVPHCCLRLPTGGGKTLLASHAIGIARDTYLARRYPVVLWLVTSSAIADQTLGALKKIGHPYRQALEAQFGGAVRIYGIDERRHLRPQDMADAATVIVATVQSFRVNNVADRNVYRDDEELEPHFAALPAGSDLARHDNGPRRGKPIASFANLLKLHRPLVIVDEAHNFTSTLSGETFTRPELPVLCVQERPNQSGWTPEMVSATRIADDGAGGIAITFDTTAPDAVLRDVATAVNASETTPMAAIEAFIVQRAAALSPAEQGEVLTLPRLTIERDGQLEIVFSETLVDVGGWNLAAVDTSLPGFALTDRPDTFEMDVDGDQVVYTRIDAAAELTLDDATDWDVAALSRWLDRTTRQRDVAQPIFLEYCRRVVERVAERIPLAQLVRGKYALRRAIMARVGQLRHEAGARGVQLLLGDIAPVLALGDNGFSFSKAGYDPRTPYSGPWRPRKHLFSQVGDLKHGGEEWMAAVQIDDHTAVHRWVRNVDRTAWSYALPTATDFFYPDFVAELKDGRKLIIEYKGADRKDSAENLEKKNIGARLQEVSDGHVLFLWAELERDGNVSRQIDMVIR